MVLSVRVSKSLSASACLMCTCSVANCSRIAFIGLDIVRRPQRGATVERQRPGLRRVRVQSVASRRASAVVRLAMAGSPTTMVATWSDYNLQSKDMRLHFAMRSGLGNAADIVGERKPT